MANLPLEPEKFTTYVAETLADLHPGAEVEIIGPHELLVDGRRLDLENLARMVRHEPGRGGEIVETYLRQLFASDVAALANVSLDLVRPRVMPRIQPESIFAHLRRDMVAHVPFVNGTVVVFVIDLPQMTVSITTEQLVRWGLSPDELEALARRNLRQYTSQLDVKVVESKEGGRAAIVSQQDGYDAARLLLDDLFPRLAPTLGGDFLVAAPARDMFVALTTGPDEFVHRLQSRVEEDFRRLPYPITPDLFYVTRDGVAGTRAA
jgi:hypothetical protein